MRPRPGQLRINLGTIQRDIERLLVDSPHSVSPVDILDLVADAFANSDNKACEQEVRKLTMELRELNLGCPKVHYL